MSTVWVKKFYNFYDLPETVFGWKSFIQELLDGIPNPVYKPYAKFEIGEWFSGVEFVPCMVFSYERDETPQEVELREKKAEKERLYLENMEKMEYLRLKTKFEPETRAELLAALKIAVRQNSLDMLMTGEELRQCEGAIAKAEGSAF